MKRTIKKMLPKNQIRALVSDSSVNEEKRTVDLTWTTGSKGLRRGWSGNYYEELSLDPSHVDMSRLNDGSHPLLAAHNDQDLDAVIGVIERAWLEGDKAGATVRFARDEISERAFQKVKDGILRNVSVGYSVQEYTDVTQDGDDIPTYRATRWQPAEISIVPIGFDAAAKTRKQDITESEVEIIERSEENTPKENEEMKVRFDKRVLDKAGDADGGGDTTQVVDTAKVAAEAAKAERKRVSEIRTAVRAAKLDENFAEELINSDVTVDQARAKVIEKLASAPASAPEAQVRVEVGSDQREQKVEGMKQAILHRMVPSIQLGDAGKHFRGMSMLRMVEELLGGRRGLSDIELATRAMTTSDMPLILADSAEKAARARYATQAGTWSAWAKTGTLRNYKQASRLQVGDAPSLLEVNEHGEFKRGSFGEEKNTIQLKDYGRTLAFTKRMLVNDDLGMLADFVSRFGTAAARLESELVYNILLNNPILADGTALFHANHGNLGSAAAINETSLNAARKAIRAQKNVDKTEYLDLEPKYLIVGPDKEMEARKMLSADFVANSTSSINIFKNSMDLIVDSRITGNKWFVACDPSQVDTVELAHLEGQEQPIVSSREMFSTSGIEIKCEHAAGAAAMDYRGLFYNPGA